MVAQPQLRAGTFYPITTGLVRSGVLSTLALAYITHPDRHRRPGSYHTPTSICVPNLTDGSVNLLPLSHLDYVPEVLGSKPRTSIPQSNPPTSYHGFSLPLSICAPNSPRSQEGITKGREVEHMLEGCVVLELIYLLIGQVLFANGTCAGFASIAYAHDVLGNSNSDRHAVLAPSLSEDIDTRTITLALSVRTKMFIVAGRSTP